jgi:hypothetical protein
MEDKMEDNNKPYVIESPTRVWLGPDAKFWAQENGMTLEQFAKHLLQQEALRGAGLTQRQGEN